MVISFHQIVDDAVGVFMALCGQVQIDHGGVQAADGPGIAGCGGC